MSSPAGRRRRARTNTGKTAVAGTDAITWTTGCKMAARRRFDPIATPTGTVHRSARASATATRASVASTPRAIPAQAARGSVARSLADL